jgi:uncharacterized RDD family membrane protein YckC
MSNKLSWNADGGAMEGLGGGAGGGMMPPGLTPPPGLGEIRPAGFWRRFVAYIIDSMIIAVISFPVSMMLLPFQLFSMGSTPGVGQEMAAIQGMVVSMSLGWLIGLVVRFFYYGWFYKNKGGSPGKLAMDLRVVDTGTGAYLNYWRTFGREAIGKLLSALILYIGYIMAGVREDKRALHDIIFDTQVIHKP